MFPPTSKDPPATTGAVAALPPPPHNAAELQPAWRSPLAHLLFWSIAASGLALDLWSKEWAFHTLRQGGRQELIPHVLEFQTMMNSGALFGMGRGQTTVFLIASALALVLVLWMFASSTRGVWLLHIAFGAILAGALGNMYDRVFIRLVEWPLGSNTYYVAEPAGPDEFRRPARAQSLHPRRAPDGALNEQSMPPEDDESGLRGEDSGFDGLGDFGPAAAGNEAAAEDNGSNPGPASPPADAAPTRLVLREYPPDAQSRRIVLPIQAAERLNEHGYVRDFIKIPTRIFGRRELWPWVFNVADSLLVGGVGVLALRLWRDRRTAHAAEQQEPKSPEPARETH